MTMKFRVGDRVLAAGEVVEIGWHCAMLGCRVAFDTGEPVRPQVWINPDTLAPAPVEEPTTVGTVVRVGPKLGDIYVRTDDTPGGSWENTHRYCAWTDIVRHAAINDHEIEVLG